MARITTLAGLLSMASNLPVAGTSAALGASTVRPTRLSITYSSYVSWNRPTQGIGVASDRAGDLLLASSAGPSLGVVTKLSATKRTVLWQRSVAGSISAIATDASGNTVVTGQTYSTSLARGNAIQKTPAGAPDAFVARLSSTGKFIYATYLGGAAFDAGTAIAVDRSGNTYVAGYTYSPDFPVRRALQSRLGGDAISTPNSSDGFVSALSPSGTLRWSTFLGGGDNDEVLAIALDAHANVYVTGTTTSDNFPLRNPLHMHSSGRFDAFVGSIASGGKQLRFSTYLGGSGDDSGTSIAVAGTSLFVAGLTSSPDLPTVHPFRLFGGGQDAFIAHLDTAGKRVLYTSFLGGTGTDVANAVVASTSGTAFVGGFTNSTDFPTVQPFQRTLGVGSCDQEESRRSCYDGFVTEVAPQGSILSSTYIGGKGDDAIAGTALGATGQLLLAGSTGSSNFPVKAASLSGSPKPGTSETFVTEMRSR